MPKITIKEETAEIIATHHFNKKPKTIKRLEGGLSNYVYEVNMGDGDYIIRICDLPGKINYYLKEQWAVHKARELGVPAPHILEVGNEVVPFPYMVVKKIEGTPATIYPDRVKVVRQMGKWAAIINTIPTEGYGHVFDWSSNQLSKNASWKDYMDKEFNIEERLKIFEQADIFSKKYLDRVKRYARNMVYWRGKTTLNHSDLRLKNILLDEKGNIKAILDWENALSNFAPIWELSIALHDLSIDEKHAFIEGYGMTYKDLAKIIMKMKIINIINYAPFIALALEKKDHKTLDQFRARLNGYFDLHSL